MARKGSTRRAARRRRAAKLARVAPAPRSLNPSVFTSAGEWRTFGFSMGLAKKKTEALNINHVSVKQLGRELSGVAEFKVAFLRVNWEPLVVPASSDNCMVGLCIFGSSILSTTAGTDVDDLLRAGMRLRPASSRFSTTFQAPPVQVQWTKWDVKGPEVVQFVSGAPAGEIGRISGEMQILVRGVRAGP